MNRRPVRLAAALAAVVVVLAGCGRDAPSRTPNEIDVDVDTPKLQQMKADAGIEDCRPGPGGGGLPELRLPCLGGGPDVQLADLKGPLLINLWWSGCGPCQDEMPALQEFYERHRQRVDVLGVDVETYPEAAIGFAEMVGATYPQVADPGGFVFDLTLDRPIRQAFPQSIVIDADGRLAAIEAVEFGDVGEIEAFVEKALGSEL